VSLWFVSTGTDFEIGTFCHFGLPSVLSGYCVTGTIPHKPGLSLGNRRLILYYYYYIISARRLILYY